MTAKGAYCLLIRLRRPQTIAVGRLGVFRFPRGYYAYCGSALGGLRPRLRRHLRKDKPLHWHVDYLLASPQAELVETAVFPTGERLECEIARLMLRRPGAAVVVRGFGSSDCRQGCPAHLVHFRRRPELPTAEELNGVARWIPQ